jgi:type II secretory pathway component PulC
MNLKKSIFLLNILVTGLIVWMATNVVFFWSSSRAKESPPREAGQSEKKAMQKSLPSAKTLAEYKFLIQNDIFNAKQANTKVPIKKEDVVLTKLDLTLKGTAVGKGHESYAIILDNRDKKEELYYLNTSIQGARITKIEKDRVFLDVNGREEALIISEKRSVSPRRRTSPVRGAYTQRRSRNIRPPDVRKPTVRQATKPRTHIPGSPRPGVRSTGNSREPRHEMP